MIARIPPVPTQSNEHGSPQLLVAALHCTALTALPGHVTSHGHQKVILVEMWMNPTITLDENNN